MNAEIRTICRKAYQEQVARLPSTELRKALAAHERVPLFIDNLAREFSGCKFKITKEQIISAVNDMTKIFVSAVVMQAEERVLSPLRQAVMKEEKARKAEMNRLADAVIGKVEASEQITQDAQGNQTSRSIVKF